MIKNGVGHFQGILPLPMSELYRRQNSFSIAGNTRAMNMSVGKFAALTSNNLPSTPASFHGIQKHEYRKELSKERSHCSAGQSPLLHEIEDWLSVELVHIWAQ